MSRLEVAIDRGALLQFYEAMWGPAYESVLTILGSTGTVMPMGDPKHGQPNTTTFTTVGGEQVAFTWSEAPASFDARLDLTDPDSFQGVVPIVHFNGTDEEVDTPDAAYWTRGSGGAGSDSAFSVGCWINLDGVGASQVVMAKYSEVGAGAEEWIFWFDGAGWNFEMQDDSAGSQIGRLYSAGPSAKRWYFVVGTYDGSEASSGIKIYEDGSQVDDTDDNSGSYTAMEDTSSNPSIAHFMRDSGVTFPLDAKLAGGPLGPFLTHKELTADEVLRLYEIGRRALTL